MGKVIELVTADGMIAMLNELDVGSKQSFLCSEDLGNTWQRAVELSADSIGGTPFVGVGKLSPLPQDAALLTADRLLTGVEAAQALGIVGKVPSDSVRWLYRTGKLAACKVAGKLRYDPKDIRDYIDRQRVGTAKETSALAYQYKRGRQTARRRKRTGGVV